MIAPLLAGLALVLLAAKLGAWVSHRLGQPSILGQLVVGVVLGPSVINLVEQTYFQGAHLDSTLHAIAELGVIFLMFMAGLEIDTSDFARMGKPAVLVGLFGAAVPIALGAGAATVLGFGIETSLFIGLVLAATSVSISAQTLMELGRLRSREGLTLMGAAVVDDVLAIAMLSGLIAVVLGGGGGVAGLVWVFVRLFLYLSIATVIGLRLLPILLRWFKILPVSEPVLTGTILCILVYAWGAEAIGDLAAITGSFLVGISLSHSPLKHEIESGMHTLCYAFFVPVFLVDIGLTANVRVLSPNDIGLTLLLCAIAVIAKWLGAGAGARLGGLPWEEALRVGVGMISRGEVGLIIANVGLAAGVFGANVFTIVVVIVLVTTVLTPPLLRFFFRRKETGIG